MLIKRARVTYTRATLKLFMESFDASYEVSVWYTPDDAFCVRVEYEDGDDDSILEWLVAPLEHGARGTTAGDTVVRGTVPLIGTDADTSAQERALDAALKVLNDGTVAQIIQAQRRETLAGLEW